MGKKIHAVMAALGLAAQQGQAQPAKTPVVPEVTPLTAKLVAGAADRSTTADLSRYDAIGIPLRGEEDGKLEAMFRPVKNAKNNLQTATTSLEKTDFRYAGKTTYDDCMNGQPFLTTAHEFPLAVGSRGGEIAIKAIFNARENHDKKPFDEKFGEAYENLLAQRRTGDPIEVPAVVIVPKGGKTAEVSEFMPNDIILREIPVGADHAGACAVFDERLAKTDIPLLLKSGPRPRSR